MEGIRGHLAGWFGCVLDVDFGFLALDTDDLDTLLEYIISLGAGDRFGWIVFGDHAKIFLVC